MMCAFMTVRSTPPRSPRSRYDRRMRVPVLLALALIACGPSTAELRVAKTTVYSGDAAQLMALAEQAAGDAHYKIADVDDGHLSFETAGRCYAPDGDIQSDVAEGYVRISNHSVK